LFVCTDNKGPHSIPHAGGGTIVPVIPEKLEPMNPELSIMGGGKKSLITKS